MDDINKNGSHSKDGVAREEMVSADAQPGKGNDDSLDRQDDKSDLGGSKHTQKEDFSSTIARNIHEHQKRRLHHAHWMAIIAVAGMVFSIGFFFFMALHCIFEFISMYNSQVPKVLETLEKDTMSYFNIIPIAILLIPAGISSITALLILYVLMNFISRYASKDGHNPPEGEKAKKLMTDFSAEKLIEAIKSLLDKDSKSKM